MGNNWNHWSGTRIGSTLIMKIYEYTIHAKQKLKSSAAIDWGITKKKIQKIIEKPKVLDKSEDPIYIAIGFLTDSLSLCIPYRTLISGIIRVITFYPAAKGRYESKILQRG